MGKSEEQALLSHCADGLEQPKASIEKKEPPNTAEQNTMVGKKWETKTMPNVA